LHHPSQVPEVQSLDWPASSWSLSKRCCRTHLRHTLTQWSRQQLRD
jgi:hypothetical protein